MIYTRLRRDGLSRSLGSYRGVERADASGRNAVPGTESGGQGDTNVPVAVQMGKR